MQRMSPEEVKKVQLNILDTTSAFCNENGLKYYLGYGTLLGAVRHRGYIPWDDDIDLVMPRPDYEILLKHFNCRRQEHIVHSSRNTADYPLPFAKISDKSTLVVEKCAVPFIKHGVNIDIFPLDGVPSSLIKQRSLAHELWVMKALLNTKLIANNHTRAFCKTTILSMAKAVLQPISHRFILNIIENRAKSISWETSKVVGCLVSPYGRKEYTEKLHYRQSVSLPFEDRECPAPIGYRDILTQLYGKYMCLPPEKNRISHHRYEAYWC